MEPKRRSLLKRLFWVLAVRDAYCAALLGRPFRLNIAQCNTDALTLDDFDHEENCNSEDHKQCQLHGHYQIQVSKLSIILRNIVEARFAPGKDTSHTVYLHNNLDGWQSELPASMSWWLQQSATTNTFALSLKISFNLQLILIHLKRPDEVEAAAVRGASIESNASNPSSQIAESAAQMISSTAFTIMTNSMLGVMPHEVFFGFFVSGIVFYRAMKQQQDTLACSSRSALDNCQMVISEARERWDPANWVMRIFDFLLSTSINTPNSGTQAEWDRSTPANYPSGPGIPYYNDNGVPDMAPEDDILHSIDFDSPTYQGMSSMANEFFLMSNYLPMPTGDMSYMAM
ncbi:hypothetical protein IFR04_013480 [Cadophora malorum]|uniref:Transcription factor domain-containing protein n=1 Tax=Cadophora malorum TaxID=108018 RepID=A0A8H7W0I1_9HELO|nr:hypothetical protein IFR04_013480 [Cadophora malorum]